MYLAQEDPRVRYQEPLRMRQPWVSEEVVEMGRTRRCPLPEKGVGADVGEDVLVEEAEVCE